MSLAFLEINLFILGETVSAWLYLCGERVDSDRIEPEHAVFRINKYGVGSECEMVGFEIWVEGDLLFKNL